MSDTANSQPDAPMPDRAPMPPPNRWGWIAYFVFIVVASIGVTAFMIVFNLRMQLKPEQLEAALKLWESKDIKSYDMIYTEKHLGEDNAYTYVVKVRKGVVSEVLMNGKPLEKNAEQKDDPRIYHSMDYLFRMVQRFMDIDTKKDAKKVFVTAVFDAESGALRHYIRRVMHSQERVQIEVKELKAR